jgi:hypothetical protein
VAAALIPALTVKLLLPLLLLADQPRIPDSHTIVVSVVPEQACPGPRQVTEALAVRLPGVVLPLGQPARPGMVRLAVAVDATGIRIDLADPEGAPLLHRVLSVARGPGECAALADTIALIIERYWREVGYDAPPLQPLAPPAPPPPPPPPPTPPPAPAPEPARPPAATVETRQEPPTHDASTADIPFRWLAAAGFAGRAGNEGASDATAMLALAAEARFGVRLSAGVSTLTTGPLNPTRRAAFRRYPWRLGGYLVFPIGIGQLEPGLGLDLDVIAMSLPANGVMSPASCSGQWCRSFGADLALGWSFASSHHFYVRALSRVGLAASYDFVTYDPMTGKSDPVWRTPSTYLELAVESGLWFP